MDNDVMSDAEREEFLRGLNLNPNAPALKPETPAKVTVPTPAQNSGEIVLGPPGVDPRTIPVDEIVFDPKWLPEGVDLGFNAEGKRISDAIFAAYKGPKGDPRNKDLHRRVTSFITNERRNRKTGGMVREQIASTVEQRDNAALLASQNVTTDDLVEALRLLAEKRNNNG